MRTTNGYIVPNEYLDVIIEYLLNNGALNPKITSIMDTIRRDESIWTSEEIYAIEYTSSNTTDLHNIHISINYIKSVIRDKKINKLIDG